MVVLGSVVAIVIFSFARRPLFEGNGEASGFSHPLTLWVTGAEDGGQAEAVARQLAGCWQEDGRSVTVGVLPGGSSSAVLDFLDRVHDTPDELLLVTDTTLSDIARDRADRLLPEAQERARRALGLLADAAPITVLQGDRLALAVRAGSPVRTTPQLLALLRSQPSRPLFGIAADSWLEGNLAALVQGAGLHGDMPYGLFTSSRSAVLALDAGQTQAVLAPSGAIEEELGHARPRELAWPLEGGHAPRTWVAVIAPTGLNAGAIATLREQAHGACASAAWSRLREGGLATIAPAGGLGGFVSEGTREAARLQALAAQTLRPY